jgi:hypothetical protein
MHKVNLQEKFARYTAHWQPKYIGKLHGRLVKLAKFKREFVWHQHLDEAELFKLGTQESF